MTGREDDTGRAVRSLLMEESNVIPVDIHDAAVHLRRRLADTRKRRRVTLAVAASVVAAREFLDAVGRYDADGALSYLTNDATVQGDLIAYAGSGDAENLSLTLAHYRAAGYKQTVTDCVHVDTVAARVSVRCAFDLHAVRSDEIGLGPYTGNYWSLTVRDGKIVSAQQTVALNTTRFAHQVWAPFASWVDINHPDDVSTMFVDAEKIMQRLTEDSNRLWEQRSAEYVAAVKQNPAVHLDEPEVAAYVAELDAICAAAQAKLRRKSKRSRSRTNRRSWRRGNASCTRRCSSCRCPHCRSRCTSPIGDERSRSWTSSSHIRRMCSHQNRWPARSGRFRACISASSPPNPAGTATLRPRPARDPALNASSR